MFNFKKHLISFAGILGYTSSLFAEESPNSPPKLISLFDQVIGLLTSQNFIQFYSWFILLLFMIGVYQIIKNHQNLVKNILILFFNFIISISFLGLIKTVELNKDKTIELYSRVIDLKFSEEHFNKVEKQVEQITQCKLSDYKAENSTWDCKGADLMTAQGLDFINIYWIMKLVHFCYFVFFAFFALVISVLIYIAGGILIIGVPVAQVLSLRFIINRLFIVPALKLNAVILFNTGVMWSLAYLLTQVIDVNKTFITNGLVSIDFRSVVLNYYFLIFTLLVISQALLAFCPRIINHLLDSMKHLFEKEIIQESSYVIDTSNFVTAVSELKLDPRKKYRGSISYFDIPQKIVRKFSPSNKKLWFDFIYTTQEKLKESQKTILPDESSISLLIGRTSGKLYRIEIENLESFNEENLMFEIRMALNKQIEFYRKEDKDELLSNMLNLLTIEKIIKSQQE